MNLEKIGPKLIVSATIMSLLLIQTYQSNAASFQSRKLSASYGAKLVKSEKNKAATPKIWSPTDNEKLIILDPRFNKKVDSEVIFFWVELNRLNYEMYSDKSFDTNYLNHALFNIWLDREAHGFGIMAAASPSNSKRKGTWIPNKATAKTTWAELSPSGISCQILGDTIRYLDEIYTCAGIGGLLEYDAGKAGFSSRSDGVLGDGFVPGIAAPTRECNLENETTKFYKGTLICLFREGIRVPQVSNAITIWKANNVKAHYCVLDRTLAKQKQPMVGFMEYVLINQSCSKYFGNKSAKY